MKKCERCHSTYGLETHHVVGRVGKDKNNPENLITLCHWCHQEWHVKRTPPFEEFVYDFMKSLYGDKFPVKVNGLPKVTQWIARIEKERGI